MKFILFVAALPFIYYSLVVISSLRFIHRSRKSRVAARDFTPPVSLLKPIKGVDPGAYENFASFCRQDYPDYEILFCVDPGDPAIPVLEQLIRDFPNCNIRLLFGSGRVAVNDKVARLVRLTAEAKHDIFVITDSDVRVSPDYIRSVVAPFSNPNLGAATCFYASIGEAGLLDKLHSISMASDFFAGILVAWMLDGVKFALGQTIATTRRNIEGFGGYQVIENRPADDLYIGRFAAEQGLDVQLLPYVVHTVPDFKSLPELFYKRVRWMTVMRHMRPWGHFGLLFTWGLPWALLATAIHPTLLVAALFLGGYTAVRVLMTWLVGSVIMHQPGLWKKMPLIPLWDLMAFAIWIASFLRYTIRWRGIDYFIREGKLVSALPEEAS